LKAQIRFEKTFSVRRGFEYLPIIVGPSNLVYSFYEGFYRGVFLDIPKIPNSFETIAF